MTRGEALEILDRKGALTVAALLAPWGRPCLGKLVVVARDTLQEPGGNLTPGEATLWAERALWPILAPATPPVKCSSHPGATFGVEEESEP